MLSPYSLINSHGKPHFGYFKSPVNEINVQDCDYRTTMNNRAGALRKHFHFKRFQYFGGISKDLIFGCALADLRYVGAVFVYVYRISDKKMLTWQFKSPLSTGLDMTNRPDNGVSSFKRGRKKITMKYQLNAQNERRKVLSIDFGKELRIDASMFEPSDYESMALCTPIGVNGWVYAQKTAALPVDGQIKCELGQYELAQESCYGHHDFSAGYMRRETFWNWACFSAPQSKKEGAPTLGLNISWGVNETGFSENCFWVGSKMHRLPAAQFKFDRDDIHARWRITSENKQFDLSFIPEGMHVERLNAGIMATNFKQLFGRFNGHILLTDGSRYDIENLYGFVEDQYSKW